MQQPLAARTAVEKAGKYYDADFEKRKEESRERYAAKRFGIAPARPARDTKGHSMIPRAIIDRFLHAALAIIWIAWILNGIGAWQATAAFGAVLVLWWMTAPPTDYDEE